MAKRNSASDWQAVSRQILDALDIRAEYASLGLDIVGREPNAKGWVSCRAVGREDRNPSAQINVGDGPGRGRYRDWVTNISCSLFDVAVMVGGAGGGHTDWKSARKFYADKAGVEIPKGGKAPADTADKFAWSEWIDGIVFVWCRKKPGTTVEAVKMAGGRLCSWPVPSKHFHCIALPIFGKNLADDDPVGWVAFNRTGKELLIPQGKDRPPKPAKTITPKHAPATWVGAHGVARLDTAEVVWKVEGITDLLALWAAIPPELRDKHVVITNPNGCNENPNDHQLASVAGKVVYVIHDADKPGQGVPSENQPPDTLLGARRWSAAIAGVALECRNVQLPYEIEEKHGKDVRDWLNEGHSYAELLEMAGLAPVVEADEMPQVQAHGNSAGGAGAPPSATSQPKASPKAEHGSPPPRVNDDSTHGGDSLSGSSGTAGSGNGRGGVGGGDGEDDDHGSGGDGEYDDEEKNTAIEEEILRRIKIEVIGELPGGKVKVFSTHHRKSETIPAVSKLTYADLLRICGTPAKMFINQGTTPIPDQYSVAQVKDAISLVAGYLRFKDEREVGLGCWQGKDMNGEPTDTVVLVNAKDAARLNGDARLRRITSPRSDGLLLDFNGSHPWFDFDKLARYVVTSKADQKWVRGVVGETSQIFSRWRWKHQNITPDLIAGLILGTWVQTLWEWRPLVAVVGPSNSGKSMFFNALNSIFGPMSIKSDQSSAAGIMQRIGNSAMAILCDEFEDSAHREKILQLFRTASRGSRVLRGNTVSGSEGDSYGLKHIPWVAAIEVGLKREPDRNRFITLELVMPPAEEWGKLRVPPEGYMRDLGHKLLAIAVSYVIEARKLAVRLKEYHHDDVDHRVIESHAVPVAMLSVFYDLPDQDANELMASMLKGVEKMDQGRSDENDLLEDILAAKVDCDRGVRYTVSQLLASPSLRNDFSKSLEANGVGIVVDDTVSRQVAIASASKDDQMLFLSKSVAANLLKGTHWEKQNIGTILKRLPGAERGQHMLAGSRSRGVTIPMAYIESEFLNNLDDVPANDDSIFP